MSEHLEQEIQELKQMILDQKGQGLISSTKSSMKWLQSVIALILVVAGLGVNWGISTSKIAALESRVEEMKANHEAEMKLARDEIDKLQSEVIEIKLHNAAGDQILNVIVKDLDEIKTDLKKLVKGKP